MLSTTLPYLRCPGRGGRCGGELELKPDRERPGTRPGAVEVVAGALACRKCKGRFPILAGVAVLVPDVRGYLLEHVKGISRQVADGEIPAEFRKAFVQAKREIPVEHIEEDLEAERVNALYVMNHYLHAADSGANARWWAPSAGEASPEIDRLVREYWDRGPLARIRDELAGEDLSLIELGCGVGGLYAALAPRLRSYLGVDSAFASIALARHLALGAGYEDPIRVPEDLLDGPVSRELKLKPAGCLDGRADFVVGDAENPPLAAGGWDVSASLNMIDMISEPERLPELQHRLLAPGGRAIQSAPYIWHELTAKRLRARVPAKLKDSAGAVEWLYERAGLQVKKSFPHVPWLFFKHVRQLELYSVHLFFADKPRA